MEQMEIPKEQIIEVEYTGAAVALQPVVFAEGDSYCCLLGPDPQAGVFGCGDSPDEALKDWDKNLQERLLNGSDDDEVFTHVKDVIFQRNKHQAPEDVSDQVKEFYNQFRPVRRKS